MTMNKMAPAISKCIVTIAVARELYHMVSTQRPKDRSEFPATARPVAADYHQDVGNLHVIDWRLWLADLPIRRHAESSRSLRFSPADWSR